MKAAVFRGVNVPMEIEDIKVAKPEPRYVDLNLQGRLHLDDLVSNQIQLTDINEGMVALETREVARSVIIFNDQLGAEHEMAIFLS